MLGSRDGCGGVELLCVTWWRIWYRRNQVVNYQVGLGDIEVCMWSEFFIHDFRQSLVKENPRRMGSWVTPRWQAPEVGIFKINTDKAVVTKDGVSGLGVVIRDDKGFVRASACYGFKVNYHPQIAEALAIYKGILLTVNTGLLPAMLESDALTVVNVIRSQVLPSADEVVVISDILCAINGTNILSMNFVLRVANMVAHGLAKLALSYVGGRLPDLSGKPCVG
ncbi:hypothetical protein Dsin_004646 [Dipteronia sinensis]|uniref:RNase H type-1 domain-containing protein n=1 Tax=Dipteronia sinensis TaxID=43782 RepID=A0AAE0EE53_9ROSI|nr:hypothetical protein Dsin_004646 [Dipteronia sinensis]